MTGNRLSLPLLVALTTVPALIIGAGLWWLSGFVPQCESTVLDASPSPDGQTILTTFSLQCGLDTTVYIKAGIHAATESFDPRTAAIFLSAYGIASIEADWSDADTIAVSIADTATINRQLDSVDGVSVRYR